MPPKFDPDTAIRFFADLANVTAYQLKEKPAPDIVKTVLTDLANAQGQATLSKFEHDWKIYAEEATWVVRFDYGSTEGVARRFHQLHALAQLLRRVWVADNEALSVLAAVQVTVPVLSPSSGSQHRPLFYQAADGQLRSEDDEPLYPPFKCEASSDKAEQATSLPFFKLDWRRETWVYRAPTRLQYALHFLIQHSGWAKVCGNSMCTRPYFIGRHGNDRYCSERCFGLMRQRSKRNWWRDNYA